MTSLPHALSNPSPFFPTQTQGGPGTFHVKIGDWGSARAVALRGGTSLRTGGNNNGGNSSGHGSAGGGGGGRQRSMTRGVGTVSEEHFIVHNPDVAATNISSLGSSDSISADGICIHVFRLPLLRLP